MRFRHVELTTNRPGRLREFYSGELGLPLVDGSAESFTVRAGWTDVSFSAGEVERPPYHVAFIASEPADEIVAWLDGRAPFLADGDQTVFYSPVLDADRVYVEDPDGNNVEFISFRERSAGSEGGRVAGVGEVGVPADDPGALVAGLVDSFELPLFVGSRSEPVRMAQLGDPGGRFIVVPTGRTWHPTDEGAVVSPLAATIRGTVAGTYTHPDHPYRVTSDGG